MSPRPLRGFLLPALLFAAACGGSHQADEPLEEPPFEEPVASSPVGPAPAEPTDATALSDRLDLGEGWLGVALEAVEGEEAVVLGFSAERELIRVTQVFPDTPAAASDFEPGDLILRFGDHDLVDVGDLIARVRISPPGTTVSFTVQRRAEVLVQPVMLGLRPEMEELVVSLFVGKPAPPVLANRLEDDRALALDGAALVVIDFWATWCGPCRRAMPGLNELHARYAPRGVVFVAVSAEEPEVLRAYVAENPIDFTVAYDRDSETSHNYFVTAYPTVFVIDAAGTVRNVFMGGDDLPDVEESLEALLAESSSQ